MTYTLRYHCLECQKEWRNENALTARWTEFCPECGVPAEAFQSIVNE